MARKVKFPPPREEIPAWFMTYSDVITLLMTFFILLLTFSTIEPEKFDRVEKVISSNTSATGLTGITLKGLPKESWVNRVRPPAARIAMRGAEMPPIMSAPARESFGQGVQALVNSPPDHKEWTSHYFDIPLIRMIDSDGNITREGAQICEALAMLLQDIPFDAALQFKDPSHAPLAAHLLSHLIDQERVRPGQVGMTLVRDHTLADQSLRVKVSRFVGKLP